MQIRRKVFIAHAADAKDFSRGLAARVRAGGFLPFLDERSLKASESYDAVIEDAVKGCSLFIFVISTGSVKADAYALTELHWAVTSDRTLLGVHAPGHDDVVPPPDIAASTCISGAGDRAAQTISDVRRLLRRSSIPRVVAVSAVLALGVVLFARLLPSTGKERPPTITPTMSSGISVTTASDATTTDKTNHPTSLEPKRTDAEATATVDKPETAKNGERSTKANPVTPTTTLASTSSSAETMKPHNTSPEQALILNELTEAYLDTGWKLAFFDDWGRPPARQTLHVNSNALIGTAPDGRVVSMSIDPKLLPIPSHYNASLAQASPFDRTEAIEVARFFSSHNQFREALIALTATPADFNLSFINATEFARETVKRGHTALCAMGVTPPRMFPNGGFAEPIQPSCSPSPFPSR